jgi:hypothetical protein
VAGRTYRVVVAGELGGRFTEAFDNMRVTVVDGHTEITGTVVDRAQLWGILRRIGDLGLTLLSVSSEEPDIEREKGRWNGHLG